MPHAQYHRRVPIIITYDEKAKPLLRQTDPSLFALLGLHRFSRLRKSNKNGSGDQCGRCTQIRRPVGPEEGRNFKSVTSRYACEKRIVDLDCKKTRVCTMEKIKSFASHLTIPTHRRPSMLSRRANQLAQCLPWRRRSAA